MRRRGGSRHQVRSTSAGAESTLQFGDMQWNLLKQKVSFLPVNCCINIDRLWKYSSASWLFSETGNLTRIMFTGTVAGASGSRAASMLDSVRKHVLTRITGRSQQDQTGRGERVRQQITYIDGIWEFYLQSGYQRTLALRPGNISYRQTSTGP